MMTVSTTASFIRYTSTGVTDYSFAFKCTSTSDLRVIVDDGTTANDAPAYTATLNTDQDANPGGTISFDPIPAVGYEIYIASNASAVQETDLKNATTFRAALIENWMDRMTMVIQQLQAEVDRCLKVGETQSGLGVGELIDPGSVVMTLYMQGIAATISTAAALRAEIDALQDIADAVTTTHILNGAVTTAKIADEAVTLAKIPDGLLSNSSAGRYKMAAGFLSANAAGRSKMADGYVNLAKLDAEVLASLPSITMYTTATDNTEGLLISPTPDPTVCDWPITANSDESADFNHGLGAVPDLVKLQLVCVGDTGGTSHGYTVGDVLDMAVMGTNADKFSCDYDATRVVMKTGGSAISSGRITIKKKGLHDSKESEKGDWRMRAVCYKFGGMLP
jgi:hypothetical protein